MSLFTDTTARIGETLIILQKIEALLHACLIIALNDSKSDENLRKLLRRDRETLGKLLQHMKDRIELPQNFSTILDELLEKRNLFIHKLFLQNWFDLTTQVGYSRINGFINEILEHGKIAVYIFIGYIQTKIDSDDSVLLNKEEDTFDEIIDRIFSTTHPDFDGKNFDEYLEGVTNFVNNEVMPQIWKKM
jgi:hypothetical protein